MSFAAEPPMPNTMRRSFLTWLRHSIIGYVAAVLLVGFLFLIEELDKGIPDVSLFIGAPFALIAILVALVWGTGPALVALTLGLFIVIAFVSPYTFTVDITRDALIIGPFVVLQLTAIVTVVRLERAYKKIARSQKQLEQANSLKDYVLIRAAHELRTPLTTILGRTQLLLKLQTSTTIERHLKVIEARAHHQRALLDNLFDLSRAQEGALQLSPCDLLRLCRDAIEDVQALSGRSIDLDCPPLTLQADEKYLFQVVANLLSNAVKYSPENSRVRVSREQHSPFAGP